MPYRVASAEASPRLAALHAQLIQMVKERGVQVSRVEVDTLFVPVARPYSAGGRQVTGNWHVLARVTTSDGVQGYGYIVALRQGLVAAVARTGWPACPRRAGGGPARSGPAGRWTGAAG